MASNRSQTRPPPTNPAVAARPAKPASPSASATRGSMRGVTGAKGEFFFDTTLLWTGSPFEKAVRYVALIVGMLPLMIVPILAASSFQLNINDDSIVNGSQAYLESVVTWVVMFLLYLFAQLAVALHFNLSSVMWATVFSVTAFVLLVVHLYLYSGTNQVAGFQVMFGLASVLVLMLPVLMLAPTTSQTPVYNVFSTTFTIPLLVYCVYQAAMHLMFINSPEFRTGTTTDTSTNSATA